MRRGKARREGTLPWSVCLFWTSLQRTEILVPLMAESNLMQDSSARFHNQAWTCLGLVEVDRADCIVVGDGNRISWRLTKSKGGFLERSNTKTVVGGDVCMACGWHVVLTTSRMCMCLLLRLTVVVFRIQIQAFPDRSGPGRQRRWVPWRTGLSRATTDRPGWLHFRARRIDRAGAESNDAPSGNCRQSQNNTGSISRVCSMWSKWVIVFSKLHLSSGESHRE